MIKCDPDSARRGMPPNDISKPPSRLFLQTDGMERAQLRLACTFEMIVLIVDSYQPVRDGLEYYTHFLTCTHASRLYKCASLPTVAEAEVDAGLPRLVPILLIGTIFVGVWRLLGAAAFKAGNSIGGVTFCNYKPTFFEDLSG
jgi:hypothetical protein